MRHVLVPLSNREVFVLDWLSPLRHMEEGSRPEEILIAVKTALANWSKLHEQMTDLGRADLPHQLIASFTSLLDTLHADMLERCASEIVAKEPPTDSHQELKTWCETLHYALDLRNYTYVANIKGWRPWPVQFAFPLLAEVIRLTSPEKADQLPPVWDKNEWHRQLAELQWSYPPVFQPFFDEWKYLNMMRDVWRRMRALGGRDRPPEPTAVADDRAARHILDTVILWCEKQQQPDPPVQPATPATDWEFAPGRFRYKQTWYDLGGTSLRLLEAFTIASGMTLTEDEVSKLTGATVSTARAYGRVSELRKALKRLLTLPDDHDPLHSVDREAWRLSLP